MKNSNQNLSQENSPVTISSDTIEYYMHKSQQERNNLIASVFNRLKSRIYCFFVAREAE